MVDWFFTSSALLRTIVIYVVTTVPFLILTEVQYQILAALHRWKILRRFQEPMSQEKDFVQSVIGTSSVTIPLALWSASHSARLYETSEVRLDAVEIVVLQIIMLLAVDSWYFWGHRFMHKNKFLWNNVHYHHHEKRNLNVYSTSYAVFVENLLLIAPVTIAVVSGYDVWCQGQGIRLNRLAIELAVIGQVLIFNLGHSGMLHHPLINLLLLPTGILQQCFGPFSAVAQDHEVHHLCPLNNFSLNFRMWDKLMGSYKSLDDHCVARKRSQQ